MGVCSERVVKEDHDLIFLMEKGIFAKLARFHEKIMKKDGGVKKFNRYRILIESILLKLQKKNHEDRNNWVEIIKQ